MFCRNDIKIIYSSHQSLVLFQRFLFPNDLIIFFLFFHLFLFLSFNICFKYFSLFITDGWSAIFNANIPAYVFLPFSSHFARLFLTLLPVINYFFRHFFYFFLPLLFFKNKNEYEGDNFSLMVSWEEFKLERNKAIRKNSVISVSAILTR